MIAFVSLNIDFYVKSVIEDIIKTISLGLQNSSAFNVTEDFSVSENR
jgi:hypothetical protein